MRLFKCKSYSHFFSKTISIYAIFNVQSFNVALTNDIVSFKQLGPDALDSNKTYMYNGTVTIENTEHINKVYASIFLWSETRGPSHSNYCAFDIFQKVVFFFCLLFFAFYAKEVNF